MLGLLAASVVLGVVFFAMLPDRESKPPPEPEVSVQILPESTPAGTSGAPADSSQAEPGALVIDPDRAPGPSGKERKYEPRMPYTCPIGPFDSAAGQEDEDEADLEAPEGLIPPGPSDLRVVCDDCCQPFIPTPDAFTVLPGPSEVVMLIKRPEVLQETDEPLIHNCNENEVRAADLSEQLMLCMRLLGTPNAPPLGNDPEDDPGKSTLGRDPRNWFADVPAYQKVQYADIYPGIDLSFYADQQRLESVFVVQPGADASAIRFVFEGSEGMSFSDDGILVHDLEGGHFVMGQPRMFQVIDDIARPVSADFTLTDGVVGFRPRSRMPSETDSHPPTLDFASYLGDTDDEHALACATDSAGHLYVCGDKTDADGGRAAFVSKIRIVDAELVYSLLLDGNGDDRALGIAVDNEGAAIVCGETTSTNFPGQPIGAADTSGRSWDAFVVKISPSGDRMIYAGTFGGSADDRAYALAVDPKGRVVIAGETRSRDFPSALPSGESDADDWNAFVARLSDDGSTLTQASIFGGTGDDSAFGAAIARNGDVYIAGETASTDLPVAHAVQSAHGGGRWDAFMAVIAFDDSVKAATYLGGDNDDRATAVALDGLGNAVLVGETASQNFPVTNALQSAYRGGNWDGFFARFQAHAQSLVYASYLGGTGVDRILSVSVGLLGRAHVAGVTDSTNLLTVLAAQPDFGGGSTDGFSATLEPGGRACRHLSYFGGSGDDALTAVATDHSGATYLAGYTASTNLLIVAPLQNRFGGGLVDACLAHIPEGFGPEPDLKLVPGGEQPGGPAYDFYVSTFEITHEEFTRFLNNAQANTNDLRGTNLTFDARGDVWFNPARTPSLHEIFDIDDSKLIYDPRLPIGARYRVSPEPTADGRSYGRHPIGGASWYGTVKYCNWLTLDTGRGAAERCYHEGPEPNDWRPVPVSGTNWARGMFGAADRARWIEKRGFRMLMDNCSGPENGANAYNEFYKVAAWHNGTNVLYGYGRSIIEPGSANYLNHGRLPNGTTEVGWFDGTDHGGTMRTLSNENAYGVHDLSGNADEWLTDLGHTNGSAERACYGGSWKFSLPTLHERYFVPPYYTDGFRGFRVASAVSHEAMYVIRVPYILCMCPRTVSAADRAKFGIDDELLVTEPPEDPRGGRPAEEGEPPEPPTPFEPEGPDPNDPPGGTYTDPPGDVPSPGPGPGPDRPGGGRPGRPRPPDDDDDSPNEPGPGDDDDQGEDNNNQ